MAFMTAADVFTFSDDTKFENTAAPLEKNGFAYCQVMRTGERERERERERGRGGEGERERERGRERGREREGEYPIYALIKVVFLSFCFPSLGCQFHRGILCPARRHSNS